MARGIQIFKPSELVLSKAKALPDGTIRDWKGKKYQKVAGKWKPYREGGKKKTGGASREGEKGPKFSPEVVVAAIRKNYWESEVNADWENGEGLERVAKEHGVDITPQAFDWKEADEYDAARYKADTRAQKTGGIVVEDELYAGSDALGFLLITPKKGARGKLIW